MKITTRLILFVLLLASIPSSVVAFLAYYNGRNAIEQNLSTHLTATALYKQGEIERWIKNNESKLENIANRPLVVEYAEILVSTTASDPEYQSAYQNLIRDHLEPNLRDGNFLSYEIIRLRDGKIVFSINEDAIGKFRENEPYFLEGRIHTFTDQMRYIPQDSKVAMHISTPILTREGRLVAVLVGHANLDILTEIIAQGKELTSAEESYLVNPAFFFVTEPWLGHGYILKNTARTEAVNKCLQHENGVIKSLDYRNVPVISAYRWIPNRNRCIITKVDQSTALKPVMDLRYQVISFGLLSIVFVSILGFGMARTITNPILAMRDAVTRYGLGESTVRLPDTSKDELGMLAREFNRMADAISEEQIKLRQRTERLFNLSADMLAVAGFDGYFKDLNPSWSRLLGFSPEELKAKPFIEFVHPDDRQSTIEATSGLAKGEDALAFEN